MSASWSSERLGGMFALYRTGPARPVPATRRALSRRVFPVILILSVLAGCATRVEAVLEPLFAVPSGTSTVTMLVATTRKPSQDPGKLYSGDRGTAISVHSVSVSIPPDRNRKIGEVQWPAHMPPDPQEEFAVTEILKVQSEHQVLDWYRKKRNAKRQVVIFVHGFNNTYADAVFRFAQIVHDSGTDASPILFTWPSRASVFHYLYDKESANYSRRALEDLIIQVTSSPDVDDVTILAHSMGGWLAAEALRGVAMRETSIPAKIRNVVLASPDIDVDVFRRQFMEMGPRRPHFVILTSTHDKALGVSRWLSGGVDRVGGSDLRPYTPLLEKLGVSVIDTSAIATSDPLGHNTFADSPEIVRLLGRRLAGQSLSGGEEKFTDQVGIATANLASSAARVAVASQVAFINPDIRELLKRDLSSQEGRMVDGQISY